MDRALLGERLAARGEPPYRAVQVWKWAARGVAGYAEMTNLPAALRDELQREIPFSTLEVEHEEQARDGTVKTLFRTRDGHPVEAVLMRYRDGRRSGHSARFAQRARRRSLCRPNRRCAGNM